jgi:spermidine/putrescine transport system ATP-binding protein
MSDRIAVMSAGKILQVGAPRAIYDAPAERFVADFIGESNFLEAEVKSVAEGHATVRLPSGVEIPASLPQGFSPSGKVTIVVRPEHAEIVAANADASLGGTVENVVYLGTDTHFHLRLDGGSPFIVRSQNSRGGGEALTPGSRAGIAIGENAAQILRD